MNWRILLNSTQLCKIFVQFVLVIKLLMFKIYRKFSFQEGQRLISAKFCRILAKRATWKKVECDYEVKYTLSPMPYEQANEVCDELLKLSCKSFFMGVGWKS